MRRLRKHFIKWMTVSLICLLMGFLLGKFKQDILIDSLHMMEVDLQELKQAKIKLSKESAVYQAQVMTDKKMIAELTQENKALNEKISITSNKLYFYERVMAPELNESGVKVFSFSIEKNRKTMHWDYELVLMQAQKNRHFVKGLFDITFTVFDDDVLKSIPLSSLNSPSVNENGGLAFKFKYFQTLKGSFNLPVNMSVDEVVLQIDVSKSRWYKGQNIEQRYEWQGLINDDQGESSEFDTEEINNIDSDNLAL